MTRDWGLAEKKVLVTGDGEISEAIRQVMAGEGAQIVTPDSSKADILVNAAVALHDPATTPLDADWANGFEAYFEAPRKLTHKLLPAMIDNKFGRVINLIGSFEPMHFNMQFAAWGALTGWAKSLTREVGRHGITINMIQAGLIDTAEIRQAFPDGAKDIPAGRLGTTADIANLVVFLSSPYARYLSGIIIPVDGGLARHQR